MGSVQPPDFSYFTGDNLPASLAMMVCLFVTPAGTQESLTV